MWVDVGPCVRHIEIDSSRNEFFLSFDDGPDPEVTPRVLDILDRSGSKASFFVIAQRAKKYPEVIREIVNRGHAVGNHSLDHSYGVFFRSDLAMKMWISDAEAVISDLAGKRSIGFRSPVGIQTPALYRALGELELRHILWNRRYFDTVLPWSIGRAKGAGLAVGRGDIVLLHDRQGGASTQILAASLASMLDVARARGLISQAINLPFS